MLQYRQQEWYHEKIVKYHDINFYQFLFMAFAMLCRQYIKNYRVNGDDTTGNGLTPDTPIKMLKKHMKDYQQVERSIQ